MFDGVAHGDGQRATVSEEVDEGTDVGVQISPQLLLWGCGVVIYHLQRYESFNESCETACVQYLASFPGSPHVQAIIDL